jgi:hypothetical protein
MFMIFLEAYFVVKATDIVTGTRPWYFSHYSHYATAFEFFFVFGLRFFYPSTGLD